MGSLGAWAHRHTECLTLLALPLNTPIGIPQGAMSEPRAITFVPESSRIRAQNPLGLKLLRRQLIRQMEAIASELT